MGALRRRAVTLPENFLTPVLVVNASAFPLSHPGRHTPNCMSVSAQTPAIRVPLDMLYEIPLEPLEKVLL